MGTDERRKIMPEFVVARMHEIWAYVACLCVKRLCAPKLMQQTALGRRL